MYWVSLLLFGSFLLVNLTLGVIYTEFLDVQIRERFEHDAARARLLHAEKTVRLMVGSVRNLLAAPHHAHPRLSAAATAGATTKAAVVVAPDHHRRRSIGTRAVCVRLRQRACCACACLQDRAILFWNLNLSILSPVVIAIQI